MNILAIDTSAGTSVAVLKDLEVLAEVNNPDNMSHAESVGLAIKDCLAEASMKATDIDLVVVGLGPGPFTGLRVGIAAAKFFAIGANAKITGICSLDAIAYDYFSSGGTGKFLVETDARRKEHFWAVYDGLDQGVPQRISGPRVAKPEVISREGLETTSISVSAAALAKISYHLGGIQSQINPIYLREPDVSLSKGKKVSG